MTADPSLFVFGHLATPEHLAAQARANLSGLFHGGRIEPRDPSRLDPVIVVVDAGAPAAVGAVRVRYSTNGSSPHDSSRVVAGAGVGTYWDDLAWRYVDRWIATIPPQPRDTAVRYIVEGDAAGSGAVVYADAGREAEQASLFGYRVDDLTVPDWVRDAVIYQIFVDRFFSPHGDFDRPLSSPDAVHGGDLHGVIQRLKYLAGLGINTIWLTPIVESEHYHGYDAVDFRRVGKRLGGPQALHALVRKAHDIGIRILLDLALNHCSWHNPMFLEAQEDPRSPLRNWFTFLDLPGTYRSFFDTAGLPELNTRNSEVVQYLCDVGTYYLSEFDVDGFRLDYALGPPLLFWSEFRSATRAAKSASFTVAEATTSPEGLRKFEGRLDGCLDFPLLQAFRRFFVEGTLDAAAFHSFLVHHDTYFDDDFSRPSFLDNHDMNRFLWSAGGDVRTLKLAATCQFSLAQPPIIYYGTEVGLSQDVDVSEIGFDACRLPMLWDERQDGQLLEFYRALIRARREHRALRRGSRRLVAVDGGLYAFACESEDDGVVVVLNNTNGTRELELPGVRGTEILSGMAVAGHVELAAMTAMLIATD